MKAENWLLLFLLAFTMWMGGCFRNCQEKFDLAPANIQPNYPYVDLYTGPNLTGFSVRLYPGSYNANDLRQRFIYQNITSMYISPGLLVTLFDDDNFNQLNYKNINTKHGGPKQIRSLDGVIRFVPKWTVYFTWNNAIRSLRITLADQNIFGATGLANNGLP